MKFYKDTFKILRTHIQKKHFISFCFFVLNKRLKTVTFIKKNIKTGIKKLDSYFQYKIFSQWFAFLWFTVFLIYFFPAFHTPWIIVFWDLDFGFSSEKYFSRIFPLWNDIWSSSNFFNSTRLYLVTPSQILGSIFGDIPGIYQKVVLYLCLQLSFFSMFQLTHTILRRETKNQKYSINPSIIFCICCWAALFYAINPWSIMRIQHIYLLAGYAILPFIFSHIMRIGELCAKRKYKKIPKHIFYSAILYIFAIGSVHYIIFIFLFIASWYVFYAIYLLIQKKIFETFLFTLSYLFLWICILGLIMHWLIPFIWASIIDSQWPENLNTIQTINMFSRASDIKNVLYLTSYWWSMIDISGFWFSYWFGGFSLIFTIFGINLYTFKNKFSSFFLTWAVVLIILSTGTYGYIAPIYKILVFDNPLWDTMWSIFRDPNKFVWLLAFCYSILWSLWIYHIIVKLVDVRQKIHLENKKLKKINLKFHKKLLSIHKRNVAIKKILLTFSVGFMGFSLFAYSYYIKPFKETYINYFYESVTTPDAYLELLNEQKNSQKQARTLYLPRYESLQSPGYGFALTSWNNGTNRKVKKPTWSVDLASSHAPTYHPLEWVNPYLSYFYAFLDSYLLEWKWKNLSKYMNILGIQKIVYHDDIVWLETYQDQQLQSLSNQNGISPWNSYDFISQYQAIWDIAYHHIFYGRMFIAWWLHKLESIFHIPRIPYTHFAYSFLNQENQSLHNQIEIKNNDVLVSGNTLDILMSQLEEKYMFFPFKESKSYDPFFRWSVMKADIPDFRWHLRQQGIDNWNWDLDMWQGMVFTYAPSSVDIESYHSLYDYWNNLIDITRYDDISELFYSENTDLTLSLDKKNKGDYFPATKGKVYKWPERKTWKVASMKPKGVKEKHPYTIELVMSGVWIQQLHGKVKFLNKQWKEIWVSYAVSPSNIENFEWIKFRGAFVTPKDTHSIKIEILSLQKPKKNTYWWLHDISLKDLVNHKTKNTLHWTYHFPKAWMYKIFMRSFESSWWGEIWLEIWNSFFSHITKKTSKYGFAWREIGELQLAQWWNHLINIENISWFNALNAIAIVPIEMWEQKQEKTKKQIFPKAHQLIMLEWEFDLDYESHVQSKKYHDYFSNGRAVSANNWIFRKKIDIFTDKKYLLNLWLNPFGTNPYLLKVKLTRWWLSVFSQLYTTPPYHLHTFLWTLSPGTYDLEITTRDLSPSLISLSDFGKSTEKSNMSQRLEDEVWCSYSEQLQDSMIDFSANSWSLDITLQRGTSCFPLAVINNSGIPVNSNTEYLISYELEHYSTKALHSKLHFYDENDNVLEGQEIYLLDHSTPNLGTIQEVEKIITTPKEAHKMKLEFLQKQIQEDKTSKLSVRHLVVKKYIDLPAVDTINILTLWIFDLPSSHKNKSHTLGKMKQISQIDSEIINPYTLLFTETYTQLWQLKTNSWFIKPRLLNIFLHGFELSPEDPSQYLLINRAKKLMIWWYAISALTLVIIISLSYRLYIYKKKYQILRKKYKTKIKEIIKQ